MTRQQCHPRWDAKSQTGPLERVRLDTVGPHVPGGWGGAPSRQSGLIAGVQGDAGPNWEDKKVTYRVITND